MTAYVCCTRVLVYACYVRAHTYVLQPGKRLMIHLTDWNFAVCDMHMYML